MKLKLPLSALLCIFLVSFMAQGQQNYWKKSKVEATSRVATSKNLHQDKYQTFTLNVKAFKERLSGAPMRSSSYANALPVVSFPNQYGKFEQFNVVEVPIFSPELAVKYPNIKTYLGYGIDNPGSRIRFSVTPQGVQTMTSYLNKPNTFTVPLSKGNISEYITYDRGVRVDSAKEFICLTESGNVPVHDVTSSNRDANDQILRTFRIAISTNGEYTDFWDDGDPNNGTPQEDALAQVVSTLNRNNEVFEVDMAITFELVTGTELIYPDGSSDPYTGSFNSQLQSTLTSEVGEANYDIGHLFVYASSTNGNAGCIGCVCEDGQKGSGFSQHPFTDNDGGPYMSDFFDIDYVPHEIGHQMGANHTFSHSTEGAGVNVEPGSGTTIMGYAGITGSNDVQDHSDPYFNYHSIRQIMDNVDGSPNNCWTSTAITNNPPVADAGPDYTIPQGTAFVLKASATDPDPNDVLTYTWEQIDNGQTTSGNFGPTKTTGGVWRSRPPSTNPNRYMPILSRVMSGELTETNPEETDNNTSWETVSTVARTLNFALTVRDRAAGNGTGLFPQSDFDLMTVTVDAASGPFAVTSANSAVTWDTGTTQTVTWDVANTTSATGPNTQNVNIKLSTDGGATFPITLASNVANDGSHDIIVPETPTTEARIMVEAVGNIFFAVNSTDFTVNLTSPTFFMSNTTGDLVACNTAGTTAEYTFNLSFVNGFTETVSFSTTGEPSGSTVTFNPTSLSADGSVTMTVSNLDGVTAQNYTIKVTGASATVNRETDAGLRVYSPNFTGVTLTTPANSETGVILSPTFKWDGDANATSYDIQISEDAGFASIANEATIATTSYSPAMPLEQATVYYWRVKPKNSCGEGSFSAARSFTTQNCLPCTSVSNGASPIATTRVIFNTIDQTSDKTGGYSDFTNVTTEVTRNSSYDLSVYVDTGGDFTTRTKVWIDWNQNCSFDDAGEEYILGRANNTTNGLTSLSPISVTVPSDAIFGNTRMRVSTRASNQPTSCENNASGEVEDYTVNVVDNTASTGDFTFEGFNLYPNPSNGNFNLQFDTVSSDSVQLQLFDVTGRLLKELRYTNVAARFVEYITFDNASKGLYLLKIKNGSKQTIRKLIVK